MLNIFSGSYHRVRGAYRSHKLDTRRETISVFRTSSVKPPRVKARPVALMGRRNKVFFSALQMLGFLAVAAWTVNNYMHLIQGLR